jgi:hypothetical protein
VSERRRRRRAQHKKERVEKKNNRRWANQLCSTVYRGGFYWSTSTAAISLIILLNHQGKLATRCASDNHISAADRLISQFVFIQPAGDFFFSLSLSLSACARRQIMGVLKVRV